ncbi:MAG TPA: helix-turn-helix transcriptional regulator [Candidatus Acidoferrales bacterium]|nr:helix-turn-helix transcriptional regulator [Candidatus Acidoferrales bacterium]
MKKVRVFAKLMAHEKKQVINRPNVFVFCETTTGVAQFRTESSADPESTVERVAGLLAMQCLVRGQNPNDFQVLVPAEEHLMGRLVSRAEELLEEGRSIACPASLSPRQREVLHSVLSNRANKEIACKLNITVRTVKFHISTLLSKFGVETRTELARRAAGFMRPATLNAESTAIENSSGNQRNLQLETVSVKRTLQMANKNNNSVRFPGRVLMA